MDYLHLSGVDFVHGIQSFFVHHEKLMLILSRAGDPKNAFLIYYPLVYGLSRFHGRRLLWAAAFTEWLNIVLKWALFGHRPYWWVQEYDVYETEKVAQYHLTCETGPGSPSGHAMVTAAVYYVILDASKQFLPKLVPHLLFIIIMLPISLSRVFIAAHFPHQVIAGTICGAFIASLLDKFTYISTWNLKKYILTSCGLFICSYVFSWALGQLGVDFHWTIPLAMKWCEKPDEWISLSTTPYNSIVRVSSIIFGSGIAEMLYGRAKHTSVVSTKLLKIFFIIFSLVGVNVLEFIHFDHPTKLSFYLFSAIKHTAIPIVVVYIIPCLVEKMLTTEKLVYKNK